MCRLRPAQEWEFLRENWRVLQFTVTVHKSVRIIDTFHQKPVHYFITSNDEVCFQSLCCSTAGDCRLKTNSRTNEVHGKRPVRFLGYRMVSWLSVPDELSMSMLPALLWTYLSNFILNWLPKGLKGKIQGKSVMNKSKSNTIRLGIVILFDYMFRPFLIRPSSGRRYLCWGNCKLYDNSSTKISTTWWWPNQERPKNVVE